jgi:heptosyltransferase II
LAKELIFMPNWIGDCACALSVIHRKISMQHTSVTLLANPPLAHLCRLLSGLPVIPYKRASLAEYRATLAEVKRQSFETVYVLPPSFSSALFAYMTHAKKRRGIKGDLRGPLLSRALPLSLRDRTRHLTYEYAMILETDFVQPEYWQGVKTDAPEEHADAIVFCPGSHYGPAKKWNGFARLAGLMPGMEIVVLGGPGDAEAADEIESAAPDRVKNLAGKTSLLDAARIISQAKVVVSNDSGLMHMAGYMGAPVVAVFGSTAEAWTRPLGSKVRIAHVKTDCSPCFNRTCRFNDYHCLARVTPDAVLALINQLLPDKM